MAWLSQKAILRGRCRNATKLKARRDNVAGGTNSLPDDCSVTDSVVGRLDYRFILLGSILPDLIDKPLGIWLLRDTMSNGRVFAHTLLFAVLLLAVGVYAYISRRKLNLLCLSFGNIAHLGLDAMWLNPRTLFWPLYGWSFERGDVSHWLNSILVSLSTDPRVYILEILGAFLLAVFFIRLIRRGKLYRFFQTGEAN